MLIDLAFRDVSRIESLEDVGTFNHQAAAELLSLDGLEQMDAEDRAYLDAVGQPGRQAQVVASLRRHRPFDSAQLRAQNEARSTEMSKLLDDAFLNQDAAWCLLHLRREATQAERKGHELAFTHCPGCGAPQEEFAWVPFTAPPTAWAFDAGRCGWVIGCEDCRIELGSVVAFMS